MEARVRTAEAQKEQYKALFEESQTDTFVQASGEGRDREIVGLHQQLAALLMLKDALNSENLELQERIQAMEQLQRHSQASCVICMENLANVVCLPCKHLALCSFCSQQLDRTELSERNDVPEPEEFYKEYCTSDNGNGRPVVFRGAAASWKAMKWSSDDYLLERFGSERISGVEHNLKETRAGGQVDGMVKLRDFLGQYNTTDIYMVSGVPKNMMKEVEFLPCLQCGGYLSFLDTNNFWMGRGGSKSVVHYDDQDNINCMIAGEKRFVFMHPSYKEAFEAGILRTT
ncbi:unnamed protein product [Symbiodinium sp. CCMP2456]|nr:unnamed protein product [Symbiodinium sp. CCMP2456]